MRLTRGGKLVLGIGLWLLAALVFGVLRVRGVGLTEGELLLAYWPGWVFGSLLAIVGALLVGGEL